MYADLLQKTLLDHDLDKMLARNHDVVAGGSGLKLGEGRLVAVIGVDRDGDARFGLEFLDQLR